MCLARCERWYILFLVNRTEQYFTESGNVMKTRRIILLDVENFNGGPVAAPSQAR